MTKSIVRVSCGAVLLAAVILMIWYVLIGSSMAVSPDAVLVQCDTEAGVSSVVEETKDCFLLQEEDTSV